MGAIDNSVKKNNTIRCIESLMYMSHVLLGEVLYTHLLCQICKFANVK